VACFNILIPTETRMFVVQKVLDFFREQLFEIPPFLDSPVRLDLNPPVLHCHGYLQYPLYAASRHSASGGWCSEFGRSGTPSAQRMNVSPDLTETQMRGYRCKQKMPGAAINALELSLFPVSLIEYIKVSLFLNLLLFRPSRTCQHNEDGP
jgi:hypothetical protein